MGRDTGRPFEKKVLDESYEATLTVKRSRITKTANDGGYFDDAAVTSLGILAEVKITSMSLAGLQLKIKQHTDLLEDE